MTKDEALKLALEAFKEINYDQAYANEITAIREALAQPEHEWLRGECVKCGQSIERQEPVAWVSEIAEEAELMLEKPRFQAVPLYITPPKAQPEQEPYGYVSLEDGNKFQFDKPEIGRWQTVYTIPFKAQPEQEPVSWRNAAIRVGEDLCSVGPFGYYDMTAQQWLDWALSVVTVHAPPPHRKPLTDEEIENLWQNTSPYYDHQDFARAIEAAHGIKG